MTDDEIKVIHQNEKNIIRIYGKLEYIGDSLHEIKTNHLPHIHTELKEIAVKLNTLENKIISNSPYMGLIAEVVKIIILSVVVAGLVLIGIKNL